MIIILLLFLLLLLWNVHIFDDWYQHLYIMKFTYPQFFNEVLVMNVWMDNYNGKKKKSY